MKKKLYSVPDVEAVLFDIRETLLDDSLRSNGDINDTNPEIDWGSF